MGHWTGRYTNIIAALIQGRKMKRGLTIDELVDAAYIDRAGPLDMPSEVVNSVRALIVTNDSKLRTFGWTIMGPRNTGNGFWLVPLETD